jgi:hypothetical protein
MLCRGRSTALVVVVDPEVAGVVMLLTVVA